MRRAPLAQAIAAYADCLPDILAFCRACAEFRAGLKGWYPSNHLSSLHDLGLILCIFAAATLYSSVGHAGASGYLASMALFTVAPDQMKPAALVLNILVAVIGTTRFVLAKAFSPRLFLPLALGSVPFAFLGGTWTLPDKTYRIVVGVLLFIAAVRLAIQSRQPDRDPIPAPVWQTVPLGMGIGLLSGLTGVGGGIYLTPVILFAGWARPREASGVSAAFILVNSVAGLGGKMQSALTLPAQLPLWAVAAVVGGLLGSYLGVRRMPSIWMRRTLAVVLLIAAFKLAFS